MKIFIKLLVLLLILACVAPFFIKGPDGRPLMSIDKLNPLSLSMPSFDAFKTKRHEKEAANKDSLRVFKWRDQRGVVHYSNRPGQEQRSELIEIKDITILPNQRQKQSFGTPAGNRVQLNNNGNPIPSPTSVPLSEIPKLVEDAKQVERLVQERKLKQDRIVEGL